MLKKIIKTLKEYEIVENNGQRLNKGHKQYLIFSKLWNKLYE